MPSGLRDFPQSRCISVKLYRKLEDLEAGLRHGALSIGNFDGVHMVHARIVERVIARARQAGGPAIIFTFDPHPVRVLRPELAPAPLTWTERKAELLADLGIDAVVAYPTDEALLSRRAGDFFQWIVRDTLAAAAIVEGPNFYFGKDREGNVDTLRELAAQAGIELEVVQPLRYANEFVSSSQVRGLIRDGQVEQACQMLTGPYRIRGMVTHGVGRGAKIGFPTANVEAIDTLLPAPGVYAGRGFVENHSWPAGINIGTNPTFGETACKVEVHLIGADESLYNQPLEVELLARLRDIQPFDSVEGLARQLDQDMQRVVEIERQAR